MAVGQGGTGAGGGFDGGNHFLLGPMAAQASRGGIDLGGLQRGVVAAEVPDRRGVKAGILGLHRAAV